MLKYLALCLFAVAAISEELHQQNYAPDPLPKNLIRRRRFNFGNSFSYNPSNFGSLYVPKAPSFNLPDFSYKPTPTASSFNLPNLGYLDTRPVFSASASLPTGGRIIGPLTYTGNSHFPESGLSLSGSLSQAYKPSTGLTDPVPNGIKYSGNANWESFKEDRGISLDVVKPHNSGFDTTLSGYVKPVDGLTIRGEHNQQYSPTGRRDGPHTSTGTVELSRGDLTASFSGTHTPGEPNSNTISVGYKNDNGFGASVSRTNTVGSPSTNTGNLEYSKDGYEAGFSVSRTEGMPSSKSANVQIPIVTLGNDQGSIYVKGESDLNKDHTVTLGGEIKF